MAFDIKENQNNNFPISCGCGNRLIVEFGKDLVEYEFHGVSKSFSDFSSRFVNLVEDVHDDLEACCRGCLGHVVLGLLDTFQDDSLAGTCDVRNKRCSIGLYLEQ